MRHKPTETVRLEFKTANRDLEFKTILIKPIVRITIKYINNVLANHYHISL